MGSRVAAILEAQSRAVKTDRYVRQHAGKTALSNGSFVEGRPGNDTRAGAVGGFDFFDGRESFINYHADANGDIFALF